MNHIVYGSSKVEESLYKKLRYEYSSDEVIHINSDIDLTGALKIIRFKPFFKDKWFVTVNLDKISEDHMMQAIALLKNNKIQLYMKVERNKELWSTIRKSNAISKLDNLSIINAKFPDNKFISKTILQKLKRKYFGDSVMKYLIKNLRFNIDKLDDVIDQINDLDIDTITLQDIKRILPPSKTKSIKIFCYNLLLVDREDLKALWKENALVSANANTKKKPYQILEGLSMQEGYLLDLIIKTFDSMIKVKDLFIQGHLTENNIFTEKDNLDKRFPFLKSMTIPTIREYISVSKEVTKGEIRYCLNEFLNLKSSEEITHEDIYLTTFKLMKRHINN